MEKPTITINIGGQDYPLWCNLNATEILEAKYGNLEEAGKAVADVSKRSFKEAIDIASDMLLVLTEQGIAYCNDILEEKLTLKPLTTERIRLCVLPADLLAVRQAIFDAIQGGVVRNVYSADNEESDAKNLPDE